MIYYVQTDETTNNITGYSSTKTNESDIEISELDINSKFFNTPFLYKLNKFTKKIEFSEELLNEYKKRKDNKLKNSKDISLKQIASLKIESMKKDLVINKLVAQMAASKLETMLVKGRDNNE